MALEAAIRAKRHRGARGESREALRDVHLALAAGEVGAVLGPSGCGKTTLLRIVAGLDRDYEGTVRLPGAGRAAMVFQEPRLLPWRTVEENLRFVAPALAAAEVDALLVPLGLSGHRRHYPGELSLGLARRAAIARALAVRPDLLLLDEPFASLDAATAGRLVDQLVDLVEGRPVTTLLVTHDVATALRLADAIFVLSGAPARLAARVDLPLSRTRLTREAAAEAERRVAAAVAAVS